MGMHTEVDNASDAWHAAVNDELEDWWQDGEEQFTASAAVTATSDEAPKHVETPKAEEAPKAEDRPKAVVAHKAEEAPKAAKDYMHVDIAPDELPRPPEQQQKQSNGTKETEITMLQATGHSLLQGVGGDTVYNQFSATGVVKNNVSGKANNSEGTPARLSPSGKVSEVMVQSMSPAIPGTDQIPELPVFNEDMKEARHSPRPPEYVKPGVQRYFNMQVSSLPPEIREKASAESFMQFMRTHLPEDISAKLITMAAGD